MRAQWKPRTALLSAALAVCMTSDSMAQGGYSAERLSFLETGSRLRVTADGASVIGPLEQVGSDSLSLSRGAPGASARLALSDIDLVELSRDRSRGSTTLTVVGGLVGVAVGLVVAGAEDCRGGSLCDTRWAAIPAIFGSGGLLIGWGAGQAFVTKETWQMVPRASEPTMEPLGRSSPGLTLSVRLLM